METNTIVISKCKNNHDFNALIVAILREGAKNNSLKLQWVNSYEITKTAKDVLNLIIDSTGFIETKRYEHHKIYNTRCRYYEGNCLKGRLNNGSKCSEQTKKFCPFYKQNNNEPMTGTLVILEKISQMRD